MVVNRAFRCVRCHGELVAETTLARCSACAASYPLLVTGIPVLVRRDPDALCAATAFAIDRQITFTETALARYDAMLVEGTRRPEALRRIREQASRFAVLYRRLLGALDHTWPTSRRAATAPESVELNLEYFIRDWSHSDTAERSVQAVTSCIDRQIAHVRSPGTGTALVLGAGGGRFAWELTRMFEHVVALDYSIPSALSWALLTRGPVPMCELQDSNVPSPEELCVPFDARLSADGTPPDAARLARMAWLVADGLDVPLRDGSVSVIISAYFTDRVSPWRLLDECERLLAPGGTFVHVGPFHMRHFDPENSITATELCAELSRRGLRVEGREWIEHSLLGTRSLAQVVCRAFACAAVKPG